MDELALSLMFDQAIASGNSEEIRECAYTLETAALSHERYPESGINLILGLLAREDFLVVEGSWYVLHALERDWHRLTVEQEDYLLLALEQAYPKFRDEMSWFVISEILGEHYADLKGLRVLQRLREVKDEQPRSLVPHGLEHLIKATQDRAVAQQAYSELREMMSDPSGQVRYEVGLSLGRLGY